MYILSLFHFPSLLISFDLIHTIEIRQKSSSFLDKNNAPSVAMRYHLSREIIVIVIIDSIYIIIDLSELDLIVFIVENHFSTEFGAYRETK